MEDRILIAGFGGQGVLLIGQVLCHAGMDEGRQVSWMPSYGPEMRGGTASCSVIISDSEIGSPLVDKPNLCIVMNRPSFDKYMPTVVDGGSIFINSSLMGEPEVKPGITPVYVPVNEVAKEAGNMRTANMAMLGAFMQRTGILPDGSIHKALADMFGEKRAHLLPVNKQAMELGARRAS